MGCFRHHDPDLKNLETRFFWHPKERAGLGVEGYLKRIQPMKFAICHELFENWDWERQCRFISEVGYTGIELAPFTLAPRITDVSAEQRRTLRQQAADHGLQIMGLHRLLAKTEGLHVTTRDAATR